MRALFLLVILFPTVHASATSVLLQGPGTDTSDYRAMLKADRGLTSPTQYYLSTHPTSTHREALLARFSQAQTAFLDPLVQDSSSQFRAVLALLPEDDWKKSDREVFLYSYFRLAQLAKDESLRDRLLTESLNLGPDLRVDEKLIPPPLLARRQALMAKASVVPLPAWAAPDMTILINGNPCGEKSCGSWIKNQGEVRVTVLSDSLQTQTLLTKIDQLSALKNNPATWVEGSCEKEIFSTAAEALPGKKAFWSLDCDQKEQQALKLAPQPTPFAQNLATRAPREEKSKPFYKSGWFWAGVGGVVAILVIKNQNDKRDSGSESSTTYGFR